MLCKLLTECKKKKKSKSKSLIFYYEYNGSSTVIKASAVKFLQPTIRTIMSVFIHYSLRKFIIFQCKQRRATD